MVPRQMTQMASGVMSSPFSGEDIRKGDDFHPCDSAGAIDGGTTGHAERYL
jgi:hypothetical protein